MASLGKLTLYIQNHILAPHLFHCPQPSASSKKAPVAQEGYFQSSPSQQSLCSIYVFTQMSPSCSESFGKLWMGQEMSTFFLKLGILLSKSQQSPAGGACGFKRQEVAGSRSFEGWPGLGPWKEFHKHTQLALQFCSDWSCLKTTASCPTTVLKNKHQEVRPEIRTAKPILILI